MKLLGIASFFLALLCVCTVGGNDVSTSAAISSSTAKSVTEAVVVTTSHATTTTTQAPVLATTVVRATIESITNNSMLSSPNAVQQTTQSATTQPPVKVTTTAADRNDSTTTATQESGTQLTQNGSLDASSTKTWTFSPTVSLQKSTSAPGTSSLHMSSLTELTTFGSPGSSPGSSPRSSPESSPGSSPGNKKVSEGAIHYSTVILPVVITLIVITLSVFSLVALYRMCQKKTPEGQENGTEQVQSDKEGVKLLSVKTTSPETGRKPRRCFIEKAPSQQRERSIFVEVRDIYEVGFSLPSANLYEPTALPPSGEVSQSRTAGEHSSQGKNKTRQLFSPQQ